MQVFLIRHPRPYVEPGICYGQLDMECEDPRVVAADLRQRIPAGTPVFSSPLHRARVLAEALDPAPRIDTRLTEIHFGDWEGRPWDSIERTVLDAWAADILHFTPPGGESVARFQQRVLGFADSLDLPRVAVVTHAGVMRALLGHWQNLPTEEWTRLRFDFGSLTTLSI